MKWHEIGCPLVPLLCIICVRSQFIT